MSYINAGGNVVGMPSLISTNTPLWVQTQFGPAGSLPDIAIDFTINQFWQTGVGKVAMATALTVSRASAALIDNLAGVWTSFGNNVLRQSNKGTLIEEARTNVVLWCRDLTQAGSWTATNITPAKDQVGIDGVANSASSIVATAGNGTIIQNTTVAITDRWQTAFVKRITGSGTINMTMDNGVTWTAVTVTAAWTRVAIPTQNMANPQVGFRIVTNGDAIAVDFVQNETSNLFGTSPILTTNASATRAADVVTVTTPPAFGTALSIFGSGSPLSPVTIASNQQLVCISDGGATNREVIYRIQTTGLAQSIASAGPNPSTAAPWSTGTSGKWAIGVTSGDGAGSFNGAAVVTSNTVGFPNNALLTQINIGTSGTGVVPWNGYITQIAIWSSARISNTALQAITT